MSAHETMSQAEWAEWQAAAPRAVGIGDRLANGATVLAARPYSTWPKDGVVFLALWRDELVTWIGRPDGTDTTWGHYFRGDLAAALADWQTR